MEFDFNSNQTVEDISKVPEQFRPLYQQGDDQKFTIGSSFKAIAVAIDGLNGALKKERKSVGELRSAKDIGAVLKEQFSVESVEDLKAKWDEMSTVIAEKSKVDPAKIKAEIEQSFSKKEQGYKDQLGKMQGTLDRHLVGNAALQALAAHKGNAKLLMPIISSQAVVVADGDEYVVRVKDPQGDYRGNGAGGFMTVEDLVKELKASADYGVAFESTAPSGSQPQQRGGTPSRQQVQQQQRRDADASRDPNAKIQAGLAARRRAR